MDWGAVMAAKMKKATGGGSKPNAVTPDLQGGFADRLYQQRRHLGWTQSELARRIWGTITDKRGYEVARNRDRISAYEAKRAQPERATLDAVAAELGLTLEQLAPDIVADRSQRAGGSGISMVMVEGRPNEVHLKLDLIMTLQIAAQIVALVNADVVANPE